MKKRIFFALAAIALLFPVTTYGARFVANDEFSSGQNERETGSLYIAAGTASVGSRVDGDVLVVGGNVTVTGQVGGDIAALGGALNLLSPVNGDVRAAAGQVTVNDRIGGDLVVAGGMVHVLPGATVAGGLYVAGGQVIVDGTINGVVKVSGGRLSVNGFVGGDISARLDDTLVIGDGAQVRGSVTYRSPREAQISSRASVLGDVEYTPFKRISRDGSATAGILLGILALLTALTTLANLGAVALVIWRWRRPATDAVQEAWDRFWPSVGRGFAAFFLVPLAAILLLISFVGTIPGIVLVLLYVGLLFAARVLGGIFLGSLVWMLFKRQRTVHVTWVSALVGTFLFQILDWIPIIGWILKVLLLMAAFGVLIHRTRNVI